MVGPKKSIVFIDAGNLFKGWKTYCKKNGYITVNETSGKQHPSKRISYTKLIKEIIKDTDFIRGYYFDAVPEPIGKKQRFFDMLRMNEITVVTKPLKYKAIKCRHCEKIDANVPHQKGVDIALATEAMNLAFENAYDLAIIVSGDNDFEDAIQHIKRKGKKVWVVSFIHCLGENIMRSADQVIRLDDLFDKILKDT